MKIKEVNGEPAFNPVTIKLILENRSELEEFLFRYRVSLSSLKQTYPHIAKYYPQLNNCGNLPWDNGVGELNKKYNDGQ